MAKGVDNEEGLLSVVTAGGGLVTWSRALLRRSSRRQANHARGSDAAAAGQQLACRSGGVGGVVWAVVVGRCRCRCCGRLSVVVWAVLSLNIINTRLLVGRRSLAPCGCKSAYNHASSASSSRVSLLPPLAYDLLQRVMKE